MSCDESRVAWFREVEIWGSLRREYFGIGHEEEDRSKFLLIRIQEPFWNKGWLAATDAASKREGEGC